MVIVDHLKEEQTSSGGSQTGPQFLYRGNNISDSNKKVNKCQSFKILTHICNGKYGDLLLSPNIIVLIQFLLGEMLSPATNAIIQD